MGGRSRVAAGATLLAGCRRLAQRRARTANTTLHQLAGEILSAARADPTRDAPLVRALMGATDPQTGQPLTDDEICDELVVFMLAGHDTTSTTLTYALWALGTTASCRIGWPTRSPQLAIVR